MAFLSLLDKHCGTEALRGGAHGREACSKVETATGHRQRELSAADMKKPVYLLFPPTFLLQRHANNYVFKKPQGGAQPRKASLSRHVYKPLARYRAPALR